MADIPDVATAIRRGEFVQSIYDSINTNKGEFWCFPLYGKSSLFSKVGLLRNYTITRYIYSTVTSFMIKPYTTWIAYIAESNDGEMQRLGKRDIVVVIRGTIGISEWLNHLNAPLVEFPYCATPSTSKVHKGFFSMYNYKDTSLSFGVLSMREQIIEELGRLLGSPLQHQDHHQASHDLPVRITITGHSLGGALATLVACDVGYNIPANQNNVEVSAFTFGSPKVGNNQFKKNLEERAHVWRYRSARDPVPWLPPVIPFMQYVHVGTELYVDWTLSPYVACISLCEAMKCHNLELHMHTIAVDKIKRGFMLPRSTLSVERLCKELVGDDPMAMEELNFLKRLFQDDE